MEYLGLLLEILILAGGLYLYMFSRGLWKVKDPALQQKAAVFLKNNATWLRIAGLAIVAIMALNIVVHIMQLVN